MSNHSAELERYLRRIQRNDSVTMERLRLGLRYILLIAVAAIMIGPFLWLLYLSLRTSGNVYEWPSAFSEFSFSSFGVVWTEYPIAVAFKNSILCAVGAVLLTVSVASLAAYPLARYDFYGKNLIFVLLLSTLMMPFQLYMIPLFLYVQQLGLTNTLWGVFVPFAGSVFGVYLIKQHYAAIPRDLEEAARVDGAGEFRLWWSVMFPLTKPAVATLAIFTFVGSWSNFLWPLIVLQDENMQTLPVALSTLTGAFVDRISYLAAGSVLAVAPVIAFFVAAQRFFLSGVTAGAVKG
jgi:putative chitobiose transport system permease protein